MPTGSLYCDVKLALRLEQYASEIGRPTSAIVNELLSAFLDNVEREREIEERAKRREAIVNEIFQLRNPKALRASEEPKET